MQKTRIHMYSTKSIQAILAGFACLISFSVSCTKPVGAIYDGESGFAFASSVLNVEVVPGDDGLLNVPVYRGSTDANNARVHFEYDISEPGSSEPVWLPVDPAGVFSLLSNKVIFSDISYRSYAKIQFGGISNLGFSDKYRMRLYLDGASSPSHRDTTVITVSRKLTFEEIGKCRFFDHGIFENSYVTTLCRAKECDVFRVMNPYSEGLVAEEYAENGLMQDPPAYIQFECDQTGHITFERFQTGMLVPTPSGTTCMAWVYYPSSYKTEWGKDFSRRDADNRKISDTKFQLCGVYCLPDFKYGFLDEGAFIIEIELMEEGAVE